MLRSKLYILATPIGNLEDITLRGLRILSEVDFVLAEDTRVTSKLLSHFKIAKPMTSFHQHSSERELEKIINLLKDGKNLALVTDAGTPGISDPGGKLVEAVLKTIQGPPLDKVDSKREIEIIPIPGPNAAVAALSISGFPTDKFLFLGFPPHKKGRKTFFQEVAGSEHTVVFYESPHRILKSLGELSVVASDRQVVVARELTKKFETIYRGTAKEILGKHEKELERGELTIVVGNF